MIASGRPWARSRCISLYLNVLHCSWMYVSFVVMCFNSILLYTLNNLPMLLLNWFIYHHISNFASFARLQWFHMLLQPTLPPVVISTAIASAPPLAPWRPRRLGRAERPRGRRRWSSRRWRTSWNSWIDKWQLIADIMWYPMVYVTVCMCI